MGSKYGVGEAPVALDAVHEEAACAVILRPVHLFDGNVAAHVRQHRHIAEPAVALGVDVVHPAVVAPVERDFDLRAAREGPEEHGGIEDVDVHSQLVHVREPLLDIGHLGGLFSHLDRAEIGPLLNGAAPR